MRAGMQKMHINMKIYIFWNQINEIMNKSRIIDMNSNNEK